MPGDERPGAVPDGGRLRWRWIGACKATRCLPIGAKPFQTAIKLRSTMVDGLPQSSRFAPAATFTRIAGLEKVLGSAAGSLPVLISCSRPFARPDRSRAADKGKPPHVLWPARREDLSRASGRGRSRALSDARGPRARQCREDGCYGRPRCLAGLKRAARARRNGSP
ncbi:hypothetical protein T492DRAFT_116678 [Pavlovales sp. CCMP2436]|nr:hypothetical protein T492DRAFT_116678 [Pavlovales sp. CCMP2436]